MRVSLRRVFSIFLVGGFCGRHSSGRHVAVLPRNGTPVVGDMLARRTGPHFSVVSTK